MGFHVTRWCATGLVALCLALQGCATPFSGGKFLPFGRAAKNDTQQTQNKKRDRAASSLKDPAALYLAYGLWQEKLGHLSEARSSYEQTLAEHPKNVDAVLGLARIDQLAGRTSHAETGFQHALQMKPKSAKVQDAAGQFYLSQEKWDKAIPLLKSAVDGAPDESLYAFHLGVALTESGDADGALPLFAKSVGEAQAHYNIGLILHKRGKLPQAEQRFERALALQPTLQEAQYWLADIRGEHSPDVQVAEKSDAKPRQQRSARQGEITMASHSTLKPEATATPTSPVVQAAHQQSTQAPSQSSLSAAQLEQRRNQQLADPKSSP